MERIFRPLMDVMDRQRFRRDFALKKQAILDPLPHPGGASGSGLMKLPQTFQSLSAQTKGVKCSTVQCTFN